MKDNVLDINLDVGKLPTNLKNFPNREWVVAGIKIMREHGAGKVSIKSICDEVGKAEEEFNQIFNGLESFYESLLEYWYEKETLAYIDLLEDIGGEAEDTMLTMLGIIHEVDKGDELAIRNWALRCTLAQEALAKVDRTRLDVAIGLFKEMGFSESESITRSKIFYTSQIGLEYTMVSLSLDKKIEMCKLLMNRN